jgi:hypothetical protein
MQARTVSALVVLVLTGFLVSSARAQTAVAEVSGGPAWVNGLGVHNSAWHLGGSGELRAGVLGFGAGLDYIYLPRASRTHPQGGGKSRCGYHRRHHQWRLSLSRTGHAPAAHATIHDCRHDFHARTRSAPMFNVAGGIDWWATRRAGVRMEVRNQFVGVPTMPVMLGARVGLVLR